MENGSSHRQNLQEQPNQVFNEIYPDGAQVLIPDAVQICEGTCNAITANALSRIEISRSTMEDA